MHVNFRDIDTVDQNLAPFNLNYPRQSHADCGFASPSPTTNADFITRLDCEAKVIEGNVCVFPVAEDHILEFDLALLDPALFNLFLTFDLLLVDLREIE